MTEAEWAACTDPQPMLKSLPGKPSRRKLRLFMAACCRRVWHTFEDEDDGEDRRAAIAVAERYADGLADDEELESTFGDLTDGEPHRAADCCTNVAVASFESDADAIECAVIAAQEAATDAAYDDWCKTDDREQYNAVERAEFAAQAGLLRCLFGNPFRGTRKGKAPSSQAIKSLAQAAYDERRLPGGVLDPVRLAILADALEEAGAAAASIAHLREAGPHVRGCHVIDHLLGRK